MRSRNVSFSRTAALAAAAALLAALFAPPAFAQSQCTRQKYKAAARIATLKAKCHAAAAKRGKEVDPACLAEAEAKLAAKWGRAEGKDDCVTSNDLSTLQAEVDAFVAGLSRELEPKAICCELDDLCVFDPGLDAETCRNGGLRPGAPGDVCHASTGKCAPPPATPGFCCQLDNFCAAGEPDAQGCLQAGGTTGPLDATCTRSGRCRVQVP